MGRPGYPAEFRRKVLDLLAGGGTVTSIAHDLDVSEQTVRPQGFGPAPVRGPG